MHACICMHAYACNIVRPGACNDATCSIRVDMIEAASCGGGVHGKASRQSHSGKYLLITPAPSMTGSEPGTAVSLPVPLSSHCTLAPKRTYRASVLWQLAGSMGPGAGQTPHTATHPHCHTSAYPIKHERKIPFAFPISGTLHRSTRPGKDPKGMEEEWGPGGSRASGAAYSMDGLLSLLAGHWPQHKCSSQGAHRAWHPRACALPPHQADGADSLRCESPTGSAAMSYGRAQTFKMHKIFCTSTRECLDAQESISIKHPPSSIS